MAKTHPFDNAGTPRPAHPNSPAGSPDRRGGRRRNAPCDLNQVIAILNNDPYFFEYVAQLAAMPPRDRSGAVNASDFWLFGVTGIDRGKFVKVRQDWLRDREVAQLAWVARETLGKDDGYLDLKRRLSPRPPVATRYRIAGGRRIAQDAIGDEGHADRDGDFPE